MPNYNTNSFFNDSSATNGTSSDSTSIIGTIDVVFVKAASLFFMFCVLAACRECRCKREPRIKDSDVYRELEQQGPGVL